MVRHMLRAKIHRARVTGSDLNYEGSITIDETLMNAAGMLPFEKVDVLNLSNGARAETYIIKGEKDSGDIILNGAIARQVQVGDQVIILSYTFMEEEAAKKIQPLLINVDENNRIINLNNLG